MKHLKLVACGLCLLFIVSLALFNRTGHAAAGPGALPAGNHSQGRCTPIKNLPSQVGQVAYQAELSALVNSGCYKTDPAWKGDNQIRDTGPFLSGKSYGTHNAVRVYYSPEVWEWLNNGRTEDGLHDGAIIIKEMYPAPAQQQVNSNYKLSGYAIMVRDRRGAYDGWFWSDGSPTIDYSGYPNAGFGLYCVNCHASAKTALTFSAVRNITGSPIVFNQTMPPGTGVLPPNVGRTAVTTALRAAGIAPAQPLTQEEDANVHKKRSLTGSAHRQTRVDEPVPASGAARGAAPPPAAAPTIPKDLVGQWYDTATQHPKGQRPQVFLTSNQCFGCHDATQNNAAIPNMIYPQVYKLPHGPQELDVNVSPYGEWRSSMMGLSGRDPVFFAQLETELNLHPEISSEIVNTCLSCHGVMGQRQITLDQKGPFKLEYLDQFGTQPFAEYGGLARDGVSCAVCHHIAAEGLGTPATYTGRFNLGPADQLFGPYTDVTKVPMSNSLGLTPQATRENQIRSSALCGSCHTVLLPVLNVGQKYPPNVFDKAEGVERGDSSQMGGPNEPVRVEHEQNTYLEWLNSKFQNERQPFDPASVQTCQDCHMPSRYPSKTGQPLQFKVASIEEETFPAADFRAPDEDLHLRVRGQDAAQPYSRHTLLGMNIFVLKMFAQFGDTLGIAFADPMATYGPNPVPSLLQAQKSALELARAQSAQVEIGAVKRTPRGLSTAVRVTNLAGHKFPSGVSFRRAFIELRVEAGGQTVWVSGATNALGTIGTNRAGRFTPLVTEFFDLRTNPQQLYQPHYDGIHPITREEQVQIYEELVKDSKGNFTTSFLSLADPVKDNRLMPPGWRESGPNAADTHPEGVDKNANPGYFDGRASSVVGYDIPLNLPAGQPVKITATLYYQTIPPYYLQQRAAGAPQGVFTQSLQYYVANLKVSGIYDDCRANNDPANGVNYDPICSLLLNEAPVQDWKLRIASTSKTF